VGVARNFGQSFLLFPCPLYSPKVRFLDKFRLAGSDVLNSDAGWYLRKTPSYSIVPKEALLAKELQPCLSLLG